MWPAAAVSGFYLAHPRARCFGVVHTIRNPAHAAHRTANDGVQAIDTQVLYDRKG